MYALLIAAAMYNYLYVHWFYTLLMFAILFSETTRPRRSHRRAQRNGAVANRALASSAPMTSRSGA
jgi:hypothetical protein